jgi:hypothetical protein
MRPTTQVRIVAVLFLIAGASALVEIVRSRRFLLTAGLLGIPTGIGLLRYSNGWRIVGVISLWASLALLGLAIVSVIGGGQTVAADLFEAPGRSPFLLALLGIFTVGLTLWELRVLTRANVRRSFELGDPAA